MTKDRTPAASESRRTGRCPACEILTINGVRCHETGCPEAWRDYSRKCFECGCDFAPESRFQNICEDCAAEYQEAA